MGKIVFLGGIGTDVGKTVATGLYAKRMLDAGLKVATVKLVETGSKDGKSQDVAVHRRLMGTKKLPEDAAGLTCPITYKFPASPELAAQLEGKKVPVAKLVAAARKVSRRYDLTLVEGAGGLMVPLTARMTTLDLIVREKWPLMLVCTGELGAINHALLSLEAIKARGVQLEKVLFNHLPGETAAIAADNLKVVRRWLNANLEGVAVDELPCL